MAVSCHREAAWVAPPSGLTKAEDFRVGVKSVSVAVFRGAVLVGLMGFPEAIVVKDVEGDQLDQLP